MNAKKLFLLSWKRFVIIVLVFAGSVILHSPISALISAEEPVFFIIVTIIIPLFLIVSIIYSLYNLIKKRKKRK